MAELTLRRGRVYESLGGVYTVGLEDGRVVEASVRGRLKKTRDPMSRVVVGDQVDLDEADGTFTVENVHPRASVLVRARLGGRYGKPIAANLDRLIAVVAADRPAPNRELIDRLLLLGEAGGLESVLVINKLDLESGAETAEMLARTYGGIGYPVYSVSAETGQGMTELEGLLCVGSSILAGASGVGKSSILRVIDPSLDLRVGAVGSMGGGRHTTVSARLIPLSCGGYVADSPGFSDASLWGIDPAELPGLFPEMAGIQEGCRFRECTHLHEPGCVVQEAVESGRVPSSRYQSYRTFREELVELSSPT